MKDLMSFAVDLTTLPELTYEYLDNRKGGIAIKSKGKPAVINELKKLVRNAVGSAA